MKTTDDFKQAIENDMTLSFAPKELPSIIDKAAKACQLIHLEEMLKLANEAWYDCKSSKSDYWNNKIKSIKQQIKELKER